MPKPEVRKGMPSVQLAKEEFSKRARERFYDLTFTTVTAEIDRIIDVAWKNYTESHKSPRTQRAGRGFNDPEFLLPIEWLETRKAIEQAEKRQKNPRSNSRILLTPPAAIKPVQERCRKPFVWRKSLKKS